MPLQYSVFTLLAITSVCGLFFVPQHSTILFVFAAEGMLILFTAEFLVRRIPRRLMDASSDNCVRIDGSISRRREALEIRALRKVRLDLLAVFLLVAFTGDWFAFFVHSELIPLPVAVSAVKSFDIDEQAWKNNLRDQGVDEDFERWSVNKVPIDREAVKTQQQILWNSWPLVVIVGLVWAMGSMKFVSVAYKKILSEFATGIAARTKLHIDRDVARLQASR